jgi:putative transposase
MASMAQASDERWAINYCRFCTGRDGLESLAVVIYCYTHELLGWHLSRSAKDTTAESALEKALINRYGTLGCVTTPFLQRSDNGFVLKSRSLPDCSRVTVQQEFITPHCSVQNGLVERIIRTIMEQCVHRQRFMTLQHASLVIAEWIGFNNQHRPHKALKIKTANQVFDMFILAP